VVVTTPAATAAAAAALTPHASDCPFRHMSSEAMPLASCQCQQSPLVTGGAGSAAFARPNVKPSVRSKPRDQRGLSEMMRGALIPSLASCDVASPPVKKEKEDAVLAAIVPPTGCPILAQPITNLALVCRCLGAADLLAVMKTSRQLAAAALHPLTFQHALRFTVHVWGDGVSVQGPRTVFTSPSKR
jgi:hypothetical protein